MSRSASGMITMWFLAPPSACTRLPLAVAVRWMYCAIGVEPTKETAFTSGCSSRRSTACLSPWTTPNTPSGSPASVSHCASSSEADGSRSDGFSTKQFPVASATGNIHIGTIAGKLNGVMPATTPSGWRTIWLSTPVPTFSENSPFSNVGAAHANSTTSMPRVTSPTASSCVLPCSDEITSASWSARSHRIALNRSRMRARFSGDAFAQAGQAARAAATASSTSAGEPSATLRSVVPVAGLNTGWLRPDRPATTRPLIKCPISLICILHNLAGFVLLQFVQNKKLETTTAMHECND